MWRFRSFHRWARAAPRSAVAELGVVRRCAPSPCNDQFMSLPTLATRLQFARLTLAAGAPFLGSWFVSSFGGRRSLSVLSNAFGRRIGWKAQPLQPGGLCHALPTSRHRPLRPRRPFHNSTATPNHALQRTATGCHGSCFSRSGVFLSSLITTGLGVLSAAHLRSYRASPPRSLSLGSLGVTAHLPLNVTFPKSVPSSMTYPESLRFHCRSERQFPARSGALSVRCS